MVPRNPLSEDDIVIHGGVCFWDKNHLIALATAEPCVAFEIYCRTIFSFSALESYGTRGNQDLFVAYLKKQIHLGPLLNFLWGLFFLTRNVSVSGKHFPKNSQLWHATINVLPPLISKRFLNTGSDRSNGHFYELIIYT